jgi:hypothetical protein
MTDETSPPDQTRRPVTMAEVREVAPDPFAASAGKVRAALGRGSQATIQRYLETLRAERRREQAITEADTPEPPSGVLENLWANAFTAAAAQVRTRLEAVTAERDHYRSSAEALAADVTETAEALDQAEAQAVEQAAEREREQQAANAALTQAQEQGEAKDKALADHLAQVQADAEAKALADADRIRELEHAAQLAERDREIEKQTLMNLNAELQDKLRVVVVERDKIFERVERIQADADSRVSKIEAAAAEKIAKIEAAAKEKIAEAQLTRSKPLNGD